MEAELTQAKRRQKNPSPIKSPRKSTRKSPIKSKTESPQRGPKPTVVLQGLSLGKPVFSAQNGPRKPTPSPRGAEHHDVPLEKSIPNEANSSSEKRSSNEINPLRERSASEEVNLAVGGSTSQEVDLPLPKPIPREASPSPKGLSPIPEETSSEQAQSAKQSTSKEGTPAPLQSLEQLYPTTPSLSDSDYDHLPAISSPVAEIPTTTAHHNSNSNLSSLESIKTPSLNPGTSTKNISKKKPLQSKEKSSTKPAKGTKRTIEEVEGTDESSDKRSRKPKKLKSSASSDDDTNVTDKPVQTKARATKKSKTTATKTTVTKTTASKTSAARTIATKATAAETAATLHESEEKTSNKEAEDLQSAAAAERVTTASKKRTRENKKSSIKSATAAKRTIKAEDDTDQPSEKEAPSSKSANIAGPLDDNKDRARIEDVNSLEKAVSENTTPVEDHIARVPRREGLRPRRAASVKIDLPAVENIDKPPKKKGQPRKKVAVAKDTGIGTFGNDIDNPSNVKVSDSQQPATAKRTSPVPNTTDDESAGGLYSGPRSRKGKSSTGKNENTVGNPGLGATADQNGNPNKAGADQSVGGSPKRGRKTGKASGKIVAEKATTNNTKETSSAITNASSTGEWENAAGGSGAGATACESDSANKVRIDESVEGSQKTGGKTTTTSGKILAGKTTARNRNGNGDGKASVTANVSSTGGGENAKITKTSGKGLGGNTGNNKGTGRNGQGVGKKARGKSSGEKKTEEWAFEDTMALISKPFDDEPELRVRPDRTRNLDRYESMVDKLPSMKEVEEADELEKKRLAANEIGWKRAERYVTYDSDLPDSKETEVEETL